MADGTLRAIETLKAGEKVRGREGMINTIIALDRPLLGDRKLYTINGKLKVTGEHPALTEKGWGVISRELYAQREYGHVMEVTLGDGRKVMWDTSMHKPEDMVEFGVGDKIAFGDGGFEEITSLTHQVLPEDTQLYTVAVDGNGTIQLEGGFVFIGLSGKIVQDKRPGAQ